MTKMTTIRENYNNIRAGIVELLKTARSAAARNVNSIMTATYWEIGRRIVMFRNKEGSTVRVRRTTDRTIAGDLTTNLAGVLGGRIYGKCVHFTLRMAQGRFFRHCLKESPKTPLIQSHRWRSLQPSRPSQPVSLCPGPPTCGCSPSRARKPAPSMRPRLSGLGWSVRQLDRQIGSQFYERIALSQNKAAMLEKAETPNPAIW
jgi:hypothetical protein